MRGIINVPTILADGTILSKEGYEKASGLYLDTRGVNYPKIPENPTAYEVKAAHALPIDDLLTEFPFTDMATLDDGKKWPAGAISRAVALSALLTSVCRARLPTAPMHSVSANEAGTGKSYLVDLISVLNTGYKAVPIDVSESNEEMDKRPFAALLAGQQFIVFGNVI
jgi:putative DNA primase/helicase